MELLKPIIAWVALAAAIASVSWVAERLSRKPRGERNNISHGTAKHVRRLLRYISRNLLIVILVTSAITLAAASVIRLPDLFGVRVEDEVSWTSAIVFGLDQSLRGLLLDAVEVFGWSVSELEANSLDYRTKTFLMIVRTLTAGVGVAAVLRTRRFLQDLFLIPFTSSRTEDNPTSIGNSSGISRGYIDEKLDHKQARVDAPPVF